MEKHKILVNNLQGKKVSNYYSDKLRLLEEKF